MKKIIIAGVFCFLATGLWAQNDDGAKIIMAAQTEQQKPDAEGNLYTIQVGVPFIASDVVVDTINPKPTYEYFRFPWNILYLYDTFSDEEGSFDVSKGYFGDKILIQWKLRTNYDIINRILISRREYTVAGTNNWIFLSSVSKDDGQYEDLYIDGGVLYEYKVEAEGVEGDEYLQKFITGIGFRSPTAVVTGNVNYDGGSPVADVTVKAESEGSAVNLGSALNITNTGFLEVAGLNKSIENTTTMQAWVKPENPFTDDIGAPIRLFGLEAGAAQYEVFVNYLAGSNLLQISVEDAVFTMKDYYPSGVIDERGDDELEPLSKFNTSFTHISVVVDNGSIPKLYINGRPITKAYETLVQNIEGDGVDTDNKPIKIPLYPTFIVSDVTVTSDLSTTGTDTWDNIKIGGTRNAFIDEIRIWNAEVDVKKIRTDYKRFISGNDSRLVTYLRANEGLGDFAYDYSREGFNYNKNHAQFGSENFGVRSVTWVTGSGNIPDADQLGVLGVTDANGNYEISAIPYSGTGESFTITPTYGQHQFQPEQKLVFLGEGSTVVNEINFVDKSSFQFKGVVLYDTRGVFQPFADPVASGAGITHSEYNMYRDNNGVPFAKGQHWLNEGVNPDSKEDDTLEEYAQIFVEGANIYIDGQIVLDENNLPEVTKAVDGTFTINVPIGNHYITVKKDGHVFEFNGRFPQASTIPKDNFAEFVQDREDQVVFIDKTRVTVVGRVVGGAVEAQKEIGFGTNEALSPFSANYTNGDGDIIEEIISSKNNIGEAKIALNYKTNDPQTTFEFATNVATGEYRISVMPIVYQLLPNTGLRIPTNPSINLEIVESKLDLNFTEITEPIIPEYVLPDDSVVNGLAYNHHRDFIYRSEPILRVIEQTSDTEIELQDGTSISTKGLKSAEGFEYPIYTQLRPELYEIEMESFEPYYNYDESSINPVEDKVPSLDGEFIINNNLALESSPVTSIISDSYTIPTEAPFYSFTIDEAMPNRIIYRFKGGMPSITPPFTRTISIDYLINGVTKEAENLNKVGIVLGALRPDVAEKTFITRSPQRPDIILRDPPGSNSFASIESGTSISITSSNSFSLTNGGSYNARIMAGALLEVGGGLAGPVIKNEIVNNFDLGISLTGSSSDGESLTQTYAFNKTISTSNEPDWVGADADLYIGTGNNYYYSAFDDITASDVLIGPQDLNLKLTNNDKSIYINKQTGVNFSKESTETFYVFSQRYILESLIPEYEKFIFNFDNGLATENEEEFFTKARYVEDIRQWKKIILFNERDKYAAKNKRTEYKKSFDNTIDNFNLELKGKIEASDDPLGESLLISKLDKSDLLKKVLDDNWEKNISFDAGAGEIAQTSETVVINETTSEFNLTVDESIALTLGFRFNSVGLVETYSAFFQQDINTALSTTEETTTKFSYILKDTDPSNLLSIDVVNTFDGNGPIFSTLGGRTSCPYEGQEDSNFFSSERIDTFLDSYFVTVTDAALNVLKEDLYKTLDVPDEERAPLNSATQRVEVPVLSAEKTKIFNVPENQNAEFKLLLENYSTSGTDADFLLIIDNTTNPLNALINIEQNGTIVRVPYGEIVEYNMTLGKSISDKYDYNDIRVILRSLCDGDDVSASVLVSAQFVPSCSEVVVSAPVNNWVYNINEAYNTDGSTNNLNIKLEGYNTTFNSFEKLDLEYRLATSPFWSKLQTYYTTQEFYDADSATPETEKSLITSAELSYGFDIAGLGLQDGIYEIRARSSCTNGTEFISEVITGTVDLNAPKRFGTPLPIDGILGAGEDLRVSFDENIFYNTAISKIEILGATNQLPINNNVSLYFDGDNNTVTIEKPRIVTGDFSLEFWMNNATTATNATIFSQTNGLNIGLVNGEMSATIGGINVTGFIATDNLFHHYTITHNNDIGSFSIYEDDKEIGGTTGTPNVQFTNSNNLVIGGNTFEGNIHDLRLWSKSLTLSNAYANINTKILGNESGLLGYWPMDEGRGIIAKDLASFKNASVNAAWDIKPKGNAYEFTNGHYLELNQLGFVQLTNTMDATISFWIKTDTAQEATIFSNGKGDGTDPVQSNGLTNKWAINMSSAGTLSFESEGVSYPLTLESVADNAWHHVTLLLNRNGSLRTYIDAEQVSSNTMAAIGGFSGNVAFLGARLSIMSVTRDPVTNEIQDIVYGGDRIFTGKIDEFRLWNSLRTVEQIDRDRFNEVDNQSLGLLLYTRMNAPTPSTGNGPRYFHTGSGEGNVPDNAVLKNGSLSYTDDVPAIKPARNLIKFEVNYVINEDDMIIEPLVSDWAVLEGQVLDVTVHRMFDAANNRQESPITWTAFIQQNDVSWYADGYNDVVDIVMNSGVEESYNIVIINRGGNPQSYNIANVPSWMSLSQASGTIAPDSQITVTATIDSQLSIGEYIENLSLQTDFGFDQKLQVELRVLAEEPDWSINPADFDYSMNIVGKIKIDGVFTDDLYDKVVALSNGELRGVANVIYNEAYQEYFVFLTVYSNSASGDPISFSIWDATRGKILQSSVNANASITFLDNNVLGTLSNATLFENTDVVEQQIELNQGWTWVSMNVNDPNFSNLNALISNTNLETSDRILSHSPAYLDTYYKDVNNPGNSTWSGTVTSNGGLSTNFMYKVNFTNKQTLNIKGVPVNTSTWNFPIKQNWNWLPYPLNKNVSVREALSVFDAAEGNIVKSQNLFAIYDPLNGWSGTLNYLEEGRGYMIKSSIDQTFKYPNVFGKISNKKKSGLGDEQSQIATAFTKYSDNMNAVVVLPDGYDDLYVYDDQGVLKGQAKNQNVGDKSLSFITIYGGDVPVELTFYIGNSFNQRPTSKRISFKGNSVLGTIANPLVLEDDVLKGFKMYPNPFNKDLVLEIYSKEKQVIYVKLYNMVGQLVYANNRMLEKGNSKMKISPQVSEGVYFLNVYLNDVVSTFRVIKN